MKKEFEKTPLEELKLKLEELRRELLRSRSELAAKRLKNISKIRLQKKEIARLLQAICEKGGEK